jgi:hypothetical protein
MQRVLAVLTALFLCASAAPLYAAEAVPAGKEDLVLDSMSKAREGAGALRPSGPRRQRGPVRVLPSQTD